MKNKVLIVDDMDLNRQLLEKILHNDYEILEAEDGKSAIDIIHQHKKELSAILLDLIMPGMDGFQVMTTNNVYMGIDASTTCTGVSVFADNQLVYYGAIKPQGDTWRERLTNEGPELKKIIKQYAPQKIYMEDVPKETRGGVNTLLILGAVQGYILGVASSLGTPIEFIAPTSWRSKAGMFDGTKEGKKREVLKQKAIQMANEKFGLSLKWVSPSSKFNEDDIAESILICATMIGLVTKERKFGKSR